MINRISIKNFKSLKDVSVETKNLNLLMGLNGMGKSSFIQVLLLLMQSDNLEKNIIDLNGVLTSIGQGRDALYQFAEEDFMELMLSLDEKYEYNWKLNYHIDKDKLTSENSHSKELLEVFLKKTKNFKFIGAERIGPQDFYDASTVVVSDKKHIGLSGEYAAHYLNVFGSEFNINNNLVHNSINSTKLIENINAWLGEISPGIRLTTKYVPEINKVILDYQFNIGFGKTNSFKTKNVGFGISYALPVILSLLTAEKGKIIIIENPESHVHPRGQSELGKLISLAASIGVQVFIETHSDHIINGVRVAVKQGLIDSSSVNISYFDKITTDKEQYTNIASIKVDKQGELSEYPKDFLDEWNNQLLKLI